LKASLNSLISHPFCTMCSTVGQVTPSLSTIARRM
jgi:hypothetical protein